MSYSQSILIPKVDFENLLNRIEQKGGANSPADAAERLRMLTVLNEQRRVQSNRLPLPAAEKAPASKMVVTPAETTSQVAMRVEDIAKFFPEQDSFKVLRILDLMRLNPQKLSWNPQNREMIINGQEHSGTDVVDIISFLLGFQHSHWHTHDEVLSQKIGRSAPKGVVDVLDAIYKLTGGADLTGLPFLRPEAVQTLRNAFGSARDLETAERARQLETEKEHKRWKEAVRQDELERAKEIQQERQVKRQKTEAKFKELNDDRAKKVSLAQTAYNAAIVDAEQLYQNEVSKAEASFPKNNVRSINRLKSAEKDLTDFVKKYQKTQEEAEAKGKNVSPKKHKQFEKKIYLLQKAVDKHQEKIYELHDKEVAPLIAQAEEKLAEAKAQAEEEQMATLEKIDDAYKEAKEKNLQNLQLSTRNFKRPVKLVEGKEEPRGLPLPMQRKRGDYYMAYPSLYPDELQQILGQFQTALSSVKRRRQPSFTPVSRLPVYRPSAPSRS